jgi:hypothetical protein
LLVTANIPSLLSLFILMMEAIHSSEMFVLTRAKWHHMDNFMHQPHHCQRKTCPCKLVGPHSQSGHNTEEKYFCPHQE